MSDANWKVPKWPFLAGDALLLAFAYFIVSKSPHPISNWEIVACFAAATVGTLVGILPFFLDYRAMGKVIEAGALGSVSEKIQNLDKLAGQISSATNEWTNAQNQAEKTSAAANAIADKMTEEVQQFSEFMQKLNDHEKSALRLETEKLHRAEGEWLRVLIAILDHIFALHTAAARSGQPKLENQITYFQNACRDIVRRVGLAWFMVAPGEPFDPERHQATEQMKATADDVVAEAMAAGYTFQGRLLRPALVRLRGKNSPAETAGETVPDKTLPAESPGDELPLLTPD
jgi:molecular chaperone GrpE (heat shock protein)